MHENPQLAEVFELLHRMELCQTREPFQWMARDAIRKYEQYERSIGNNEELAIRR